MLGSHSCHVNSLDNRGVRRLVETRTRFINQIYVSISPVITELWSISIFQIYLYGDLKRFISLMQSHIEVGHSTD